MLALYPNGGFQAQGQYNALSQGFAAPFQAQGGWRGGPEGIMLQGTAMKEGAPVPIRPMFDHVGGRVMSFRVTTRGGTLISYCQR